MDIVRFWFVWNPSAGIPRARHSSKGSAQAEAERLARLHPGQQFIVLKSVGGAVIPSGDVEPITFVKASSDDIPF